MDRKCAGHGVAPFRLTLRRQMILVAYFAVIFAVVNATIDRPAADAGRSAARVFLLLSPWVLGGLVALFDRPGPVRGWSVACLLFLFYPALAVDLDLTLALDVVRSGWPPSPWAALVFNLLIAGPTWLFFWRMAPARCPECARSTLIPLVRLSGQSRRLHGTGWCAGCGRLFWRGRRGAWQRERRATWIDPAPAVAVPEPVPCPAADHTPSVSPDHPRADGSAVFLA
jgi:hypothetical protein